MSGAENATKTQQLFNFTVALRECSNIPYLVISSWQEAFGELSCNNSIALFCLILQSNLQVKSL